MLQQVIDQRRRDLGGFEVGRVLPFGVHKMVGPFIFFDHIGPADFAPGLAKSADVRPHPHIGLATVTYLFEGEIMHRDSVGSQEAIQPGEVNWMTAGSGITHSERFEKLRAVGGPLHGIQSWVALPGQDEETGPAFAHYGHVELPTVEEGGLWARLIAGEGEMRGAWESYAKHLKLADKVQFLGQIPWHEMSHLYRSADAFLFTSLRDSFGTQVLEAMGHGLPILTLDHQGVGTFVPSEAGIKVRVTSPQQTVANLAEGIRRVALCPEERLKMGEAAHAFARTQTWERRAEQMSKLYEEVSLRTSS